MSKVTATALLNEARKHIGVVEKPDGSNKTPFGVQYGWNGVAWCAIFTSCMFENVGALDLIFGKNAYTPTYAKRFYDKGQWGMTPKPGALVFFAWGTGTGRWKGIQHVGIVESVEAGGAFVTIEGNVSNRVKRIRRSMTYVAGFAYPAYGTASATTPTTPPSTSNLLRRGDKGTAVKTLQTDLNRLGYGLVVDGDFGFRTEAAVKRFQSTRGLVVDGIVGPVTSTALAAAVAGVSVPKPYPGKLIKYGSKGSDVKWVQTQLNRLRGAGLVVDGDFGAKTLAAVKSFQRSRRLRVDGIVGPVTWAALR